MEDTIAWIKRRGYYDGQIVHYQREDGQAPEHASVDIHEDVRDALESNGITDLYAHQAQAITAIRNGTNTVVATPTASGKTLTYAIPALERAIARDGKTIYIAPYNALLNDQADTLTTLANSADANVDVGVYTGDTSDKERERIRSEQPDIILMTPDMVHNSLLPWATSARHWKWLIENLTTIVADEVHEYRGVFGSHISLIFRRLNRLCTHYDADPQYICCSATIGNPVEHAANVTGQQPADFTLIDEDTSESGPRHWIFWNPPRKEDGDNSRTLNNAPETNPTSPDEVDLDGVDSLDDQAEIGGERYSHHAETVRLFCDLVALDYQTLAFTTTRQGAERYANWSDDRLRSWPQSGYADNITAYHAALPETRREEIEHDLRTGDLKGVWSTNALELGIDIGTLDAVLLDGYPGSVMNTLQRAGRAGRGNDPSIVALVGGSNPLDQHILQNPSRLFNDDPEHAAVNPENEAILPDHILCAADELPITPEDSKYFGDQLSEIVTQAEEDGRLDRSDTPPINWTPTTDSPQWDTNLRSISDREITLIDRQNNAIGHLDYRNAIRDIHPGAIYEHQKDTYKITSFDTDDDIARCKHHRTNGYTQALREKSISITDKTDTTTHHHGGTAITTGLASMMVSETTTGYLEYDNPHDDSPYETQLDDPLPPHEMETNGFWIEIPGRVETAVTKQSADPDAFATALHATQHALISLLPTELLCDRQDIAGMATETHPETNKGTIFIHDTHAGGAGISQEAYAQLPTLLERTLTLLKTCQCSGGCPSCIYLPNCADGNQNLDKHLAITLLSELLRN